MTNGTMRRIGAIALRHWYLISRSPPRIIDLMYWPILQMEESAANRKESRGSHAREDFAARDDKNWMKHTLAWIDNDKRTTTIDYRPVHEYTLSNEVAYIPPKERVY